MSNTAKTGTSHPASTPTPARLDLELLAKEGVENITNHYCGMAADCASLCLKVNGHCEEVLITIGGDHAKVFLLCPLEVTEIIERTHNDLSDAAEYGASLRS